MIRLGVIRGPNISPRDSVNYSKLEDHNIEPTMIGMFSEGMYDRTSNKDETFYAPTREIESFDEIEPGQYDVVDVVSLCNYLGSERGVEVCDKVIPVLAENRHPSNADPLSPLIMNKYSHCLCYTKDSFRYAEQAGITRKTQIYPSVNLDVFHPREEPKDWKGLRVLFNAKPTWEKGFPQVVACANMNPDVEFYFRCSMNDANKEVLPENCHYVPEMPYHKLADLYRSVDMLVHPANHNTVPYWEQWGNVILEALASGLYVVSTDNGTIPEILRGTASTIIPQKNLEGELIRTIDSINMGYVNTDNAQKLNREVACYRYNPAINCMRYSWIVEQVMGGK